MEHLQRNYRWGDGGEFGEMYDKYVHEDMGRNILNKNIKMKDRSDLKDPEEECQGFVMLVLGTGLTSMS